MPPLGYGENVSPSILFVDDAVLPTVSTCSLTFRLPIDLCDAKFKEKMDLAILGSQGFFGQI